MVAYIDGSYNKGPILLAQVGLSFWMGQEKTFFFPTDKRYTSFWNVAGELLLRCMLCKYAVDNGISECSLYYDYMGIEMWATKGMET